MRIIGGTASGIDLKISTDDDLRPTAGASKKALFDSLGGLAGMKVADLFAGAGGLGFEAASRGAGRVLFIEKLQRRCTDIQNNIGRMRKAGVSAEMSVIRADVMRLWDRPHRLPSPPDIIFADPPYAESVSLMSELLSSANFAEWAAGAALIWELPEGSRAEPLWSPECKILWKSFKIRKYGIAVFDFLKVDSGLAAPQA